MLKYVSRTINPLNSNFKTMDTISLNSSLGDSSCSSSNDDSLLNESLESTNSSSSSSSSSSSILSTLSHHNPNSMDRSNNRLSWTTNSLSSSTSTRSSSSTQSILSLISSPSGSSSPSKSASSASSSTTEPKIVIKIFTKVLCSDLEYKTLSISSKTSCKEIIKILLKKFRLQQKDSNLFYLTLEIWIKRTGIPIRSVMTLDDDSCPATLQSCYPQKDLKFNLLMRRGENIKVYNKCPQGPSSASVLLSEKTNVEEFIKLLINVFELPEPPEQTKYELYQYSPSLKIERKLNSNEFPVAIKMDWPNQDFNIFQLRLSSPPISPSISSPLSLSSSSMSCCACCNNKLPNKIINSSSSMIVENFKKNLKSELALNLFGVNSSKTLPSPRKLSHSSINHHGNHGNFLYI